MVIKHLTGARQSSAGDWASIQNPAARRVARKLRSHCGFFDPDLPEYIPFNTFDDYLGYRNWVRRRLRETNILSQLSFGLPPLRNEKRDFRPRLLRLPASSALSLTPAVMKLARSLDRYLDPQGRPEPLNPLVPILGITWLGIACLSAYLAVVDLAYWLEVILLLGCILLGSSGLVSRILVAQEEGDPIKYSINCAELYRFIVSAHNDDSP